MVTSTRLEAPFLCLFRSYRAFVASIAFILTAAFFLTPVANAQSGTITKTAQACGYTVVTTVTYTATQTTFTWTITNNNPGNGSGGTTQDLSHWSQKLDVCVDPTDLVPGDHNYGVDNSQTCLTGNVVKFDRGTSGTNTATFDLTLNGIYTPVLVDAVFKRGNESCCAQIWGVGCCELEVTCPANTNLGTFNCNTLANIPAVPTTLSALQAAPYNIIIGTNPCGTVRFFVASDAPAVNVCSATDQTISRVITIYDDLNNNSLKDPNEQSAICTFTYTIEVDDNDPTITCPAGRTVECLGQIPAAPANLAAFLALTGAAASDDCDQSLDYSVSTGPLVGGACGGTVTRTHTVTDNCGNTASCTQVFTVDDNTDPTITCPAGGTFTSAANIPAAPANLAAFLALPGAAASDNCDQSLSYSASDGPLVGTACGGTITRTHTVTDDCGNAASCTQVFTINDDADPTITCPANATVECLANIPAAPASLAAFLALPGASASDNTDQSLTYSVTTGALVGGPCGGTVTRTHTVTDDCGNSASCNQVFTVDDNTDPTVTTPEGADFTAACEVDPDPLFTDPVFSDNCGTPTVVETNSQAGGAGNSIIYTRTWTATDACGNDIAVSQSITVPPCPIPPPPPTGDEGCTPGYWKNHPDAWCSAYNPEDEFFDVFTGTTSFRGLDADLTLNEALTLGGGGFNALARHAVAALLNACSDGVNYPYTEQAIITAVVALFNGSTATLGNQTFNTVNALKDELDEANNLGCPLGNTTQTLAARASSSGLALNASPNPFRSIIRFDFTSALNGNAKLELFDLLGRRISIVYQGQVDAGVQKSVLFPVGFDQRVPMIYRLTVGDKATFGKLLPFSTE